ncbi:condensation domain-containing protein, partial [Janthinobacterium sp. PSPC1-1]|uniref:condensation domain-containing protein n=1 Tax=Janthinobacterium sp. PSPC1-1 TaxID=2804581 RepID=UPI003CEB2B2F
ADAQRLDAFLAALQAVVDRHDVLRTAVMAQQASVPVQVVCRQVTLEVGTIDLDTEQDTYAQLQARLKMSPVVDMARAPLLYTSVARDGHTGEAYLLVQLHHIILDHVGVEVIQAELMAHMQGGEHVLTDSIPYREFVAHALHQARYNDASAFFRDMLWDVDESTAPFGLLAMHDVGMDVDEARKKLDEDLANRIRLAARSYSVSSATVFHTAWALVLALCSGRDDVVFGTVLSGRLQGTRGAQDMLGMFINTLPLRLRTQGLNVTQLLMQTDAALKALLPYEQASLAMAQRCSSLQGGAALFSAILNYRHSEAPAGHGITAGGGIEILGAQERTNYPFTVSVDDMSDGFVIDAQIAVSAGAERVLGYLEAVLAGLTEALLATPDQAAADVAILPLIERQYLLQTLNATQADYPQEHCIHELFEAQVARTPAQVALVYGDEQ